MGDASAFRWLRVEVKDPLNPAISYLPNVIKVRIDNEAPTATITMDKGPCSDINVNDTITGTYAAADPFFGSVGIQVLGNPGGTVVRSPSYSNSTGEAGTWRLATTGMTPCGYVVQLSCSDRALIGYASGTAYYTSVGHTYHPTGLGFCLRK